MNFNNHREQNRKERGVKELNMMCASYDSKCSAIRTLSMICPLPSTAPLTAGNPQKTIWR